jgi:IS30 family transposase
VEGAGILQARGDEWANPPQNTNGLIRQYFPKGTDFTQVSEDEINEVQRKLNDRP